jgi:hypothetical protein
LPHETVLQLTISFNVVEKPTICVERVSDAAAAAMQQMTTYS